MVCSKWQMRLTSAPTNHLVFRCWDQMVVSPVIRASKIVKNISPQHHNMTVEG